MADATESGGVLQSIGEALGNFISGVPAAIGSFFSGVGSGAGVQGMFDWICLILGIALLAGAVRGFTRGRIVGPMLSGAIGVLLMGWAVS